MIEGDDTVGEGASLKHKWIWLAVLAAAALFMYFSVIAKFW